MQPGCSQPIMLPGDRPMPRVAVPSWKLYGWSIRNPPEDRGWVEVSPAPASVLSSATASTRPWVRFRTILIWRWFIHQSRTMLQDASRLPTPL